MKKWLAYGGVVLIFFALISCEKDDICASETPTTPSVYIKFYDNLDPESAKSTGVLRCYVPGMDTAIQRSGSEIRLPLRLDNNTTVWVLSLETQNEDGTTRIQNDTLSFEYAIETLYVDKACGYRSIFRLADENPVLNNNSQGQWIKTFTKTTNEINDDIEEHLKIYY